MSNITQWLDDMIALRTKHTSATDDAWGAETAATLSALAMMDTLEMKGTKNVLKMLAHMNDTEETAIVGIARAFGIEEVGKSPLLALDMSRIEQLDIVALWLLLEDQHRRMKWQMTQINDFIAQQKADVKHQVEVKSDDSVTAFQRLDNQIPQFHITDVFQSIGRGIRKGGNGVEVKVLKGREQTDRGHKLVFDRGSYKFYPADAVQFKAETLRIETKCN